MNTIGFNCFRRFVFFPEMNLGDITLLVGGNNSGKSTLVKAFLLCVDNLRLMRVNDLMTKQNPFAQSLSFFEPVFRFDANEYGHDVKIKTFSRAIYNKRVEDYEFLDAEGNPVAKSFPSTITFKFSIGQFGFKFVVSGNRHEPSSKGKLLSVTVEDKEAGIRFGNNYEELTMSYEVLDTEKDKEEFDGVISYSDFLTLINSLEEAKEKEDLEEITRLTAEMYKIAAAVKAKHADDDAFMTDDDVDIDAIGEILLNHMVKETADDLKDKVYGIPLGFMINEVGETVVENVITNMINYATLAPEKEPEYKEGMEQDEYERNLRNYKLKEHYRKFLYYEKDKMLKSQRDLHTLMKQINVQYISAHAANQNTLYNTSDANDYIAQVVYDFYLAKINVGEREYVFVKNWMKKFGIGEDFKIIDLIPGEAYSVDIYDADGSHVPLADKGMGSIQLMVLLLRLATIFHNRWSDDDPTIIVIEEPEQNLHPKVQSFLADLFLEVNKEYNCNFIIETHSEYIIRKTQVLVAQENYEDEDALKENNPFMVYYFDGDNEKKPYYQMEYELSGAFKDKFGEGFFDEASKLDMTIIRKEFEQKKKNRK